MGNRYTKAKEAREHEPVQEVVQEVEQEFIQKAVQSPAQMPKIKLRAGCAYHNAAIPGGVGVYWRDGEVREVTWQQFEQLMADSGKFDRIA